MVKWLYIYMCEIFLCADKGQPPLTATAAVYVRVADENDNPPRFNVSHYKMSVAENMPKYSFVGKVSKSSQLQ